MDREYLTEEARQREGQGDETSPFRHSSWIGQLIFTLCGPRRKPATSWRAVACSDARLSLAEGVSSWWLKSQAPVALGDEGKSEEEIVITLKWIVSYAFW